MTVTINSALQTAARRLQAAGIDSARLDARLLLGEVLRVAAPDLVAYPERPLTPHEDDRFLALVERRCRRQPLAQLLGRREFWGLNLRLTADTLDPRADSETLIEAALAEIGDRSRSLRLLDLGTGTGCLLLALLSELPNATGLGVDCSEAALAVARANAADLELADRAAWRCGSWGEGVTESFDLVISNPPYIPSAEIDRLMPEVARYEPRLALDGGTDGLACYREIAAAMPRRLRADGWLVLEIGSGQAEPVAAIFAAAGLYLARRRRDLGNLDRCLVIRWNR
jgi:release factor glutamine methyltransferase